MVEREPPIIFKEAVKYAVFGLALLVVVGIMAPPVISASAASLG